MTLAAWRLPLGKPAARSASAWQRRWPSYGTPSSGARSSPTFSRQRRRTWRGLTLNTNAHSTFVGLLGRPELRTCDF
eukprot:102106-Pyramimonas_sp.AAC.1